MLVALSNLVLIGEKLVNVGKLLRDGSPRPRIFQNFKEKKVSKYSNSSKVVLFHTPGESIPGQFPKIGSSPSISRKRLAI